MNRRGGWQGPDGWGDCRDRQSCRRRGVYHAQPRAKIAIAMLARYEPVLHTIGAAQEKVETLGVIRSHSLHGPRQVKRNVVVGCGIGNFGQWFAAEVNAGRVGRGFVPSSAGSKSRKRQLIAGIHVEEQQFDTFEFITDHQLFEAKAKQNNVFGAEK